MELVSDLGQVEVHFGLVEDKVNIGVRKVHGFAPNVPWAQKSFWPHSMNLLGDVFQMEGHSGLLGDSINLHAR
jgi:hypothetical protein